MVVEPPPFLFERQTAAWWRATTAVFGHPYGNSHAEDNYTQKRVTKAKTDDASDGKDYGHNDFKCFHDERI